MFNIGQNVVCIRRSSSLEEGVVYKVSRMVRGRVIVEGMRQEWFLNRFEPTHLLTEEELKDEQLRYYKQKTLELASELDCDTSTLQMLYDTRAPAKPLAEEMMRVLGVNGEVLADLLFVSYWVINDIISEVHVVSPPNARKLRNMANLILFIKGVK